MMRRQSLWVVSLCALCYLAGMLTSQISDVAAQERGQQSVQPQMNQGIRPVQAPTRAEHGQALYFPLDEIKANFVANRQGQLSATHLAWDPFYRFTVMTRPYYDPPQPGRVSEELIHWDDAEMHENKTQIYIMVDGSGVLALGGEPTTERASADGQHSGGPLEGATLQRVEPGDWVVIPPFTWHQAQPDEGETMIYGMCHVETRNTMP